MPRIHNSAVNRGLGHQFIEGDALSALDKVKDGSCRLVLTSPPYNIGKSYEREQRRSLKDYAAWLKPIVEKACKKVTMDGHLCWQVGNHINNGELVPLDYIFYNLMARHRFHLRNRIVWHFNFGLNASKRFSGRYETLLWFTKSDEYFFQLDPVRIPQLYPGKRHAANRGTRAGLPSGNPKGKNPTDFWTFSPEAAFRNDTIWELPNVKANHPEKTVHPCQFPSELAERCILALTEPNDTILDPFVGAGTSVLAAAKHGRHGIGIDKSKEFIKLARKRLADHEAGRLLTRPMGKPVSQPRSGQRVASVPVEWRVAAE